VHELIARSGLGSNPPLWRVNRGLGVMLIWGWARVLVRAVQVQAQAPFEGSLSASPAGFVVATLLLRDKGKGILKDDCVCSIAYNALSKASQENAPQLHAQSPSSNFAGIYVEKIILRFGLPVVSFDDDFSCL
jgi:hypothetical protein